MRRLLYLALLALALPLCTTTASVPRKKYEMETESLEGTWRVTYWTEDGKELSPEREMGGIRFRFTKQKRFVVTGTGHVLSERFYKAFPARHPAEIEIYQTWARPVWRGIYCLRGRRLTLCGYSDGKQLPKALASKPGNHIVLFQMVREK